jgi:Domain of unknown function (DUF5122) beta-propeller
MMKIRLGFLILLFLLVLFPVSAFASTWAKSYGGSEGEAAYSIQQTSDGGFIVAGYTATFGAGKSDIWILKLNANGNITWQKTYGGSSSESHPIIQETSDGGFIVAVRTTSFGAGDIDIWVLKLNSSGNVTWQKTYGGSDSDYVFSIQETLDGGFIVAGSTYSYGAGIEDFLVLKLDANGNVTWQKTYGGSDADYARSIHQTSDGGFIVAGRTYFFEHGQGEGWILKLDANGNVTWQKIYGGSYYDGFNSIQETLDGGYIVAGAHEADATSATKFWVLKLDANGNVTWQKIYGDSKNHDVALSIQQTSDGGFIVAGVTEIDGWNYGVLKLDANGNVTWQKTYGGSSVESDPSIQEVSDGGFIVAGKTGSFGANGDFWVLKLDANGNVPGCDLIQDTYVVPANTSVIPANTGVIPEDTAATVTNTAVVPYNTDDTVEEQCFYAGDLVFTPVTPCRIVDTRLAGGAIPPGGIRSYNVWGSVASQGGNPAGCPSPKGEPYTAHINVTVVPLGNGNIVAYPFGSTAPNASLVNYRATAQNVANSGTVKTCFNCSQDIFIKSNAGTAHVIIDVLGYDFEKP